MTLDPEQLLQEARAGDADTLGQLLELYRRYVALLARVQIGKRLRGKVDASDIVQETFLDAHRNFAHFRGASEAQLVHWLRQILAAKLADLLRRYLGAQARDVRLEREIEDAFEHSSVLLDRGLVAPQSSPSQQVVRREQAVLLADALAQLNDDYREALDMVQGSAALLNPARGQPSATDTVPVEPLGDFRIVREIGRGGMGIVYEAVQLSLGRRVALKVLPFATALDAKQLQRFKNEAQAAAQLHHTNIVPVYAVGCERGVHFYAMQLIEGQNLADLIAQLRRQDEAPTLTQPALPRPESTAIMAR